MHPQASLGAWLLDWLGEHPPCANDLVQALVETFPTAFADECTCGVGSAVVTLSFARYAWLTCVSPLGGSLYVQLVLVTPYNKLFHSPPV